VRLSDSDLEWHIALRRPEHKTVIWRRQLAGTLRRRVGLAPALGGPLFWAIGLAVVSLGGWGFGVCTGIHSTRIAAWMLAQVPLYLLTVTSHSLTLEEVGVAVLLQAAVVLTLADRCTGEPLDRKSVV